jgi:hypothetical protein
MAVAAVVVQMPPLEQAEMEHQLQVVMVVMERHQP